MEASTGGIGSKAGRAGSQHFTRANGASHPSALATRPTRRNRPLEPRLQNHGPVLQPKGEIEPIRDEAACLNAVSAVSTKPPLVTIQLAPAALQGRFKLSNPNRDRNRPPATVSYTHLTLPTIYSV